MKRSRRRKKSGMSPLLVDIVRRPYLGRYQGKTLEGVPIAIAVDTPLTFLKKVIRNFKINHWADIEPYITCSDFYTRKNNYHSFEEIKAIRAKRQFHRFFCECGVEDITAKCSVCRNYFITFIGFRNKQNRVRCTHCGINRYERKEKAVTSISPKQVFNNLNLLKAIDRREKNDS